MSIPKPAFWITAAALAAAISIPAIAQQPAQNESPAAAPSSNTDRASDDRGRAGWRWRDRDRYSEDDEDGWGDRRRYRERGYGRDGDDRDGGWRRGSRDRSMMGHRGMMEHHGMMGRRGMMGHQGMGLPCGTRMVCGPQGGRVGEAMLARLEGVTQPTAEQRPAFDKLKDAIAKGTETVRAACPTERPITPPGRLAAAEKRLSALLDAVRLVRPAMDEYYRSLSDEQKARLYISRFGRALEGRRGWQGGNEGRSGDREQYREQNRRDERTQYDADDDNEMETEHL